MDVQDQYNALPDGDIFCHGNFHPDNVILTFGHPVLIDWPGAKRAYQRRISPERWSS